MRPARILLAVSSLLGSAEAHAETREQGSPTPETPDAGRFEASGSAGASRRSFLGSEATTADVGLTVGGMHRDFALAVTAAALFGATDGGVPARAGRGGAQVEYRPHERFRLGAGAFIIGAGFKRATNGEWELGWGLGIRGHARFDLVAAGAVRPFVFLAGDASAAGKGGLFGASLGLGLAAFE